MRLSVIGLLALIAATPVLAQQSAAQRIESLSPPSPDLPFERGGLLMPIIPADQCIREDSGGLNCFTWTKRPTLIESRQVYPAAALAAGRSGMATLRCTVTNQGALSACAVSSESP